MIIQCPNCATKFKFDENKITGAGIKLKCSKCKNIFVVNKPNKAQPANPAKPAAPPVIKKSLTSQGKSETCPYCKKPIDAGTHFCPHCGQDVTRKKKADNITCPKCGKVNPPDSRFCVGCGANLQKSPKEAPPKKQDVIVCSQCGVKNPADGRFCVECGAKLSKKSSEQDPSLSEKMRKMYEAQGLDNASDDAGGTLFPFTAGWGDEYSGDTIKRKGEDIKLIMTLKVISGPDEGKEYTITKKHTIIGRSDADIIIDDFKTSRNHAEIEILGNKFLLKDLESTNGTFLNETMTPADFLSHEDLIQIGDTVYQVIVEEERFV